MQRPGLSALASSEHSTRRARECALWARAVQCPCPRRACAAWAVSARRAVEPGIARRSDRDMVHGIKEIKVPHGGCRVQQETPSVSCDWCCLCLQVFGSNNDY
jgi:hypothetical protein